MTENTIDRSNTDPNYWEKILKQHGEGKVSLISTELKKNGLEGTSLEGAKKTEETIKTGLDREVERENTFSSEAPMNKSGLLPCQRAKLENETSIARNDSKLGKSQ